MKIFLRCLCGLMIAVSLYPFIYYFGGSCSVCKERDHVVHDYEKTLGFEVWEITPYRHCADNILNKLGDPLEIEFSHYTSSGYYNESDYCVYMKYPSFTFFLSCTDENKNDPSTWDFYGTIITDPSIQFNNGVHIGMSRKQVIWAYRHIVSCSDPGVELGDSYCLYGGLYWDNFSYDENDHVTSIIFLG